MTAAFGATLRRLRHQRGLSIRDLAALAHRSKSHLHELETGAKPPTLEAAHQLDTLLDAGGQLVALVDAGTVHTAEAVELVARVRASDTSPDTVDLVEQAVDDLASAYPTTSPADLLVAVRRRLADVGRLLDGRATLAQHRRLVVAAGWLSVLRATVHIDLRQRTAAAAHLATAADLAGGAEHREIAAWCVETRAWDVLTQGGYRAALDLSRQAQQIAPVGSSAYIQATAQEARAWARLGDRRECRSALDRVEAMAANLPVPERPEHHYRYDPTKARAYAATTLAWAGDPAAVEVARSVLSELDPAGDGGPRPRRSASARLDLGLALVAAGEPDEAAAHAVAAVTSGRVVPSNWWRAEELAGAVERAGVREAVDLAEAVATYRPVADTQRP